MAKQKEGRPLPTPSPEKIKAARKAGMKAKKPKKPKSKTEAALYGYISRYNSWVQSIEAAARRNAENEAAEKRRKNLATVVSGL